MAVLKGKVVKILDKKRLIINLGYKQGVKKDMKFIVYGEGDDVKDPETGNVLGKEEIVKHRVKVKHIQENFTIVESDVWIRTSFDILFAPQNFRTQKEFILKDGIKESKEKNLAIEVGDLVREDVS